MIREWLAPRRGALCTYVAFCMFHGALIRDPSWPIDLSLDISFYILAMMDMARLNRIWGFEPR